MLFRQLKHRYAKLETQTFPKRQSLSLVSILLVSGITAIITILLTLLTTYLVTSGRFFSPKSTTPISSSPTEYKYHCGNSTAEARALGCTFDHLSVSWLPSECSRDYTAEFLVSNPNGGTWKYWKDQEGTIPLTRDEIEAMTPSSSHGWSSNSEHWYHCAHLIKRMHKGLRDGKPLDSTARSLGHTEHCLMVMLDGLGRLAEAENIETPFNMGYGRC